MVCIHPGKTTISSLYTYILLAVVIMLGLWIYFPVLDFPWIVGPDLEFVAENPLLSAFSADHVWDIFLSDVNGRYQPLAMLSYMFDDLAFSGNSIEGHHLINLILHLFNVLLLFGVVSLLSRKSIAAVAAALLLALHPMNVDAVAPVFSRSILLCTFFFLLGILSYLLYIKKQKAQKGSRIPALFFILALFSNPSAILFPFALVLIDYSKNKNLKKSILNNIPLFVISLGGVIISLFIMASSADDLMNSVPGIFPLIILKINALASFVVHFIFPFGQAAFHPLDSPGLWNIVLGLGILIALVGVLFFFRKNRIITSCIWFFIFGAVISLFLATQGLALYREQDAYLPYLGLYLLMALTIDQWIVWLKKKKILAYSFTLLIPLAWIVMLAFTSLARITVYSNSETLWTDVIEKYPGSHHAFFMRGNYWAMNGLTDKAKFDYQQCIRLNENAYEAVNNIGLIHLGEGEPNYALAEFNRSIQINDSFYKSYLNRGIIYMRLGKNDLAMADMNRAAELEPDEPLVYYNRGLLYERMNLLQEAINDFSTAISLDPFRFIFYKDRGKAYVWKQEFRFAELDYSKALDLDPSNAEMWFRRSLARVSQDKIRGGLEDAFMARKLGFPVEEEYLKGLSIQVLKLDSVLIE